MLRQLPGSKSSRILVGADTADDAGVYRLDARRALVQTVDFFTPIVDDPFEYGEIAAANALSDVYAMGGRPLTALNIMGMPEITVPPKAIAKILQGGASKLKEANCALLGGHTIRNPEPIYGLSVTGLVSPGRMITNAEARPGDFLILTKPLGTGIVTTGIKRNLTSEALKKIAVDQMRQLNTIGAVIAEKGLSRAGTDITGFGLLGHLASLCRASKVGAEIDVNSVPAIHQEVWDLIAQGCVPGGSKENLRQTRGFVRWQKVTSAQKILLTDAQTSGGLLLCVSKKLLPKVVPLFNQARQSFWVVGKIISGPARIVAHS